MVFIKILANVYARILFLFSLLQCKFIKAEIWNFTKSTHSTIPWDKKKMFFFLGVVCLSVIKISTERMIRSSLNDTDAHSSDWWNPYTENHQKWLRNGVVSDFWGLCKGALTIFLKRWQGFFLHYCCVYKDFCINFRLRKVTFWRSFIILVKKLVSKDSNK